MVSIKHSKGSQGRSRGTFHSRRIGSTGIGGPLSEVGNSSLNRFRKSFTLTRPNHSSSTPASANLGILANKIGLYERIGTALKNIEGVHLREYKVGCTQGTSSSLIFYCRYKLEIDKKRGGVTQGFQKIPAVSLKKIAEAIQSTTGLSKAIINPQEQSITFAQEEHGDFSVLGRDFSVFAQHLLITAGGVSAMHPDSNYEMKTLPMPKELREVVTRLNSDDAKKGDPS